MPRRRGCADPINDASTPQCAESEAGEIAAKYQTGHGRAKILIHHPQGNEGAEEAIRKLNDAGRDD